MLRAEDKPLSIRRVFVPADRESAWPVGDEKYLPVPREEVEDLIRRANQVSAEPIPAARIKLGVYRAAWQSGQLAEGEAALEVVSTADRPTLIPLDHPSIAIREPKWSTLEEEVMLGTWGRSSASDRPVGLMVPRSDQLTFRWRSTQVRDSGTELQIPLRLLPADSNRLILNLPPDVLPVVSGGVILERPDAGEENGAAARTDSSGNLQRWTIALPGHQEVTLRLTRPGASSPPTDQVGSVFQRTNYELSNYGLAVTATFQIEDMGERLSHIALTLDPRLLLTSVEEEGSSLNWQVEANDSNVGPRAAVRLSQRDSPTPRTIVATAWAPLELNKSWALPRLSVIDTSWKSGNVEILLPGEFELLDVNAEEGRDIVQTDVVLPEDVAGEMRVELAQLSAAATTEVVVRRRRPQVAADVASSIELGELDCHARTVVDLEINVGQRHVLSIELAPNWTVDNVECLPRRGLHDWYVEHSGARHLLHVQLSEALGPERSLRLIINGRFARSAAGEPIHLGALAMLSAPDIHLRRCVWQLIAERERQIELQGTYRRIPVAELTSEDKSRFADPSNGLFVVLSNESAQPLVRLSPAPLASKAEIEVDVLAVSEQIELSYRLRQSGANGNGQPLHIVFDSPLKGTVRWSEVGSTRSLLVEKVDQNTTFEVGSPKQVWILPAVSGEPESPWIEARVVLPWSSSARIPLPQVKGVAEQNGHVIVRATGNQSPVVKSRGLTEEMSDTVEDHRDVRKIGTFRYRPSTDAVLTLEPSTATEASGERYVRWAELTSACSKGGNARHLLSMQVSNRTSEELRLRFPRDWRVDSMAVDGCPAPFDRRESDGLLHVALPQATTWIDLIFVTRLSTTGGVAQLEAPLPELNLPILAGRWTVWTPTGVNVTAVGGINNTDRASWRERVFGSLARSADQRPDNPLRGGWWPNALMADAVRAANLEEAKQFVQLLEIELAAAEGQPIRSWMDLLSDLAQRLSAPREVFVDVESLTNLGIGPSLSANSANAITADSANDVGDSFSRFKLALLLDGQRMVVTSHRAAALAGHWIPAIQPLPIFEISESRHRARSSTASSSADLGAVVALSDWPTVALETSPPVRNRIQAFEMPLDWQASEFRLGPNGRFAVTLAREDSFRAYSWSVFLLATALAAATCRRRRPLIILSVGMATLFSLFLPAIATGISQAAALGFVMGLAVGCLRDGRETAESRNNQATMATLLVGVVVLGTAARSSAEEIEATIPTESGPTSDSDHNLRQILVPMDDQRQPVGSKYLVSESLLLELHRRASHGTEDAIRWVIRDATYSGNLINDAEDSTVGASVWTAEIDLEVLARDTVVELPFDKSQAEWAATARLDGIPIELQWEDGATGCQLFVREPGPYQLVVSFVPQEVTDGRRARIELSIPRVADSKVRINVPANHPPIEINSGEGDSRRTAQQGSMSTIGVGTTDRLRVTWPVDESSEEERLVDELLWIHVTEQGITLEAKFALAGDGAPTTLPLDSDQRLRPRAVDHEQENSAANNEPAQGDLTVPIDSPESAASRPSLTFDLADGNRLGRIPLPEFRIPGARFRNRRLAITCDWTLECALAADTNGQAIAVESDEFLTSWGTSERTPQQVFQIPGTAPTWQLLVQPRQREALVDDTLSLIVNTEEVRVEYDADIRPGINQRFDLHLEIPTTFHIDDVIVTAHGDPVRSRWARRGEDELVVFFAHSLNDNYRLTVSGDCPIDAGQSLPLPVISMMPHSSGRCRLHLFRKDNTLVALDPGDSVRDHADPEVPVRLVPGTRMVGAYWIERSTSESSTAEGLSNSGAYITLLPQVAAATGESLTSVYREGGRWMAAWSCLLRVERGLLDAIELRLPDDWVGPFLVQPEMPFEVREANTVSRANDESPSTAATVRLPRSLSPGDEFRFDLRGPLNENVDEGLTVPRVEVDNVAITTHFISVPADVDGRPTVWTRVGVHWAGQVPASLQPTQIVPSPVQLYRVTDEPFLMRLQDGAEAGSDAVVLLADVRAHYSANRELLVDTGFVLQPNGLTDSRLALPENYELVDVFVDGESCRRMRDSALRWRLSVPSPALPHLLNVVTRRARTDRSDGEELVISRPALLSHDREVPTELTIWTLATPHHSLVFSSRDADTMQPVDHALTRLSHFLRAAEAGIERSSDASKAEMFLWSRAWKESLEDARYAAATRIAMFTESAIPGQIPTQLSPSERLDELVVRFQAWKDSLETNEGTVSRSNLQRGAPHWNDATGTPVACFISEGGPQSLSLSVTPTTTRVDRGVWLAAVVVAVSTFAVAWAAGRPEFRDQLWQWPQALGVALGWLWWTFLSPSWVALVIVAAGVLLVLRLNPRSNWK